VLKVPPAVGVKNRLGSIIGRKALQGAAPAIDFYDRHPIDEAHVRAATRRHGAIRLTADDLFEFDQDHYGGIGAVDALAQRAGVAPGPAAASAFVIQAVTLGSGVAVVAAAAPHSAPPLRLAAAALVAVATIGALVWRPTAAWLGRLVNAAPPLEPLALSAVFASTLLTVVGWSTYGAAFWMLARGLIAGAPLPLTGAVAAFTLGYILGLLALFAPGGVGVREVVLIGLLAPFLGAGGAVAVSVASRVLLTVLEAAAAVLTFPLRHRPQESAW